MSHPNRLAPSAYVGVQRYLLTISTHNRRRLFVDHEFVALVLLQFRHAAEAEQFELSAYCFMPDHLHALVTGRSEASDFRRFVKLAKQRSAHEALKREYGRLWQRSYWDYTLRGNDMLVQKIRYLIANPIRAGLVDHVEQFPFFGSDVYSRADLVRFVQEAPAFQAGARQPT